MRQYMRRVAEKKLAEKIEAMGAVLVEGPKYCGKTTLSRQLAGSVIYMAEPETRLQNLMMARTSPSRLLQGATPRLIDEWQLAPQLWDAVRGEVDKRDESGQFILTGSAVPPKTDEIFHSGAGRFGWLKLRTMSLWESGESTGDVSLGDLFRTGGAVDGEAHITLDEMAFLACRGGWPKAVVAKRRDAALAQAFEYYEAVTRTDISRVDDVERNPELAKRLMRSYARHQGSQATVGTMLADIRANEADNVSENTLHSYLRALKKIFVVEDAVAWNPNLRSKTAIRTSDTRYFADPSIATAALGLGPDDLMADLNTFGLVFETLCVRDLRTYAEANNGSVSHFRDKNGLECDAVVHLRNGRYGLVEVKLGGDEPINAGAKTLLTLAGKIDTDKMHEPSFMMVLTAVGQYAYRRDDGVLVVPVGSLKD